MRRMPSIVAASLLFATSWSASAADPQPEIRRDAVAPQAQGAAHTLRQIPEACARLEGMFTGQASEPYRFAVVRTGANCQPRARFVDAETTPPDTAAGWKLNDLLRVPNAACPGQQAVVRVWRKPVAQAVELDGQGRSRVYLEESRQAAAAGDIAEVPMFSAQVDVEGSCGG